jgi:hypothetical protein
MHSSGSRSLSVNTISGYARFKNHGDPYATPPEKFQDIVQMSIEVVGYRAETKRLHLQGHVGKYAHTLAARDVLCYGESRELGISTLERASRFQLTPFLN